MAAKALPAQDVLLQLLSYDPETGKLFWKERGPEWFADGKMSAVSRSRIWNAQNSGVEAFTSLLGKHGHRCGYIWNVQYLAHRVIWKMEFGDEPKVIDHSDGDASNNRLSNLRNGTSSDNQKNRKLPKNNTTGFHGIWKDAQGRWRAEINTRGRRISLGSHETKEAAIEARKAAERKYGFHPNHGRSA